MEFRIADTFTSASQSSAAMSRRLSKTSAFDLQTNPTNPGLQLHRIDASKDENFWSVRVNRDIRIIVHKTAHSFLLAYVGHHDDALERNFLGPAPIAGSAGTGKTVVALHRARRLAQSPDARVLFTTFSEPLAFALERKLQILAFDKAEVVPRNSPSCEPSQRIYRIACSSLAISDSESSNSRSRGRGSASMFKDVQPH